MDFFKQALSSSSDGILICDAAGVVLFVNDAYSDITGLQKEVVLHQSLRDLLAQGIISKALSLEAMESDQVVSTIHQYVSGKSALTTAAPIHNDSGTVIGAINNTRNISELIELRHKLEKNRQQTIRHRHEIHHLWQELGGSKPFIYRSAAMDNTVDLAKKVASFDSAVLITGESGTGKEVVARYIHNHSRRRNESFIKVNCAAIPSNLFESELFGYEKGAFTGANLEGKMGFFEMASNGTLLLDEIGELSMDVQSKLLRVLQEGEIYRIGGKKPIELDTRIISCTNRNLLTEVERGTFREDLFFRLNVFPIEIQPLRERREDIEPLLCFFLERLNRKYKTTKTISSLALEALTNYQWPGNVRELENIVEYLFVISQNQLTIEDIPGKVLSNIYLTNEEVSRPASIRSLQSLVDLYEKSLIEEVLKVHPSLRAASKSMGIHHTTLSRKMQKYGLIHENYLPE